MADNLPDVYLKFTGGNPDIRGESMDAAYPAKDGWLGIQSFSFGFGWGGLGSGGAASNATLDDLRNQLAAEQDPQRRVQIQSRINALERSRQTTTAQNGQPQSQSQSQSHQTGATRSQQSDSGQLRQKEFRFAKSPGAASKDILLNLQKGPNGEMGAELIVCRAAGVDMPTGEEKNAKTPFLKFVFSNLQIIKSSMNISKESPVSEDVEFWFGEVRMETIWTDNETGVKLPGGKNTISFNFDKKDSQPQFEGFMDTDG